MAHDASTSFLVDRLIKALIKNPSAVDVDSFKRSALRRLANAHSVRSNQFEVTARLDGLEEKWMIQNNDPLANALHLRRAELSIWENRWTPEILSLLLQLSNRPIDRPILADLALPKPDISSTPPTWAVLMMEDPLDDQDGLWENVDFTAEVSDDDQGTESVQSDHSALSQESSVAGQAVEACIETLIEPAANISLLEIRNAQYWNTREDDRLSLICEEYEDYGSKTNLTELQAGREVIFTLLGLPTSIFRQGTEGQISVSKLDFLEHASQESLTSLLEEFAVIASKLLRIRQWVEKDERFPFEQAFQAALASRLEVVDRTLSAIQIDMLSHDVQTYTSLLELYNKTFSISRLLLQVHDISLELDTKSRLERPFRILECLFDKTCVNESIGDAEGYEYMANLFFDCFQTYLKPIRLWMEQGQLTGCDGVIFIKRDEKDVQLDSVWQDQFHLLKDSIPNFVHLAASKIFNTGKSVDFLRRLLRENYDLRQDRPKEVAMTYESVCQSSNFGLLSPFAELFDMALNRWIARRHQTCMSELRAQLDTRCGLQSTLDALEYIYFADGALNTKVNNTIFESVDRGNLRWDDDFIMNNVFQSAFPSISSDRLQVYMGPKQQETRAARRSMSALERIRVSYTLPWPVANVIRTDSIEVYQRVFIFLTQLQRAKYLLQLQTSPRIVHATGNRQLLQLYTLRHRLLWLTNTILAYIYDIVIAVATADMRIAMDRAEDIDSMIAVHHAYITNIEDQCFLLEKHTSLRQAIISLLDLTILFSDVQASYAARQTSFDSEGRFIGAKASQKRATHSYLAKADSGGDDSNSDFDSEESGFGFTLHTEPPDMDKLKHMLETFRNLHGFVTAAIRGISRANSAPSWEMLAENLATGLEK